MQNSKKFVAFIILIAISASLLFGLTACTPSEVDTLIVYNWADYIGYDVMDMFKEYYKEETGREINVIYSMFDTNENMMTTVTKGGEKVDLVCPSDYALQKLMQQNMLQPINFDKDIPDYGKMRHYGNTYGEILEKINDVFGQLTIEGQEETASMNDYFVPYMWGTLGILYNTKYVSEEDLEEYGWGLLWNQNGNLGGKILMKDSIRDTYCAAAMFLKEQGRLPEAHNDKSIEELMNTVDDDMVAAVEQVLVEQRKHLKGYEVDFGKDDMIMGHAYADLAWSGDAIYAMEEAELAGVELGYFVPEAGGNIWFDGWAIPVNAPNPDAARIFIDFMCIPEVAILNTMDVGYVNSVDPEILKASPEVVDILVEYEYADTEEEYETDAESVAWFFEDPARYPDMSQDNLGVMRDFGANVNVINMWERVKSGLGDSEGLGDLAAPVYVLIALACLAVVIIIAYLIRQKLKFRPVPLPPAEDLSADGASE